MNYWLIGLVMTTTWIFDLENLFSSAHARDEYLWQQLVGGFH